ncbi:uncharacterized protein [Gossypium hirsutum]|uniref:Uncharacterized protein isoform X1 n=1 Tax=Gossypium hirsutum TaxID=3635 RepID=A0A1U8JEF0_GOSHI|nr:uncharacterized protein LOC107905045 isoform X1 [Gossypium hirsutum]
MHFASISFHCWFFVPLPVLCSSSPLKKSLVLCSSSPPPVTSQETNLVARCRRVYGHAHDYHINFIQITGSLPRFPFKVCILEKAYDSLVVMVKDDCFFK